MAPLFTARSAGKRPLAFPKKWRHAKVASISSGFDDIMEGDDSAIELAAGELPGPCDGLQRDTFKKHLATAIDGLPDREKLVLALYYDEELNLKEIGEVIGVSESRVSQIHSQAAMRLRARLSDWN